jgi:hypothetical protein
LRPATEKDKKKRYHLETREIWVSYVWKKRLTEA